MHTVLTDYGKNMPLSALFRGEAIGPNLRSRQSTVFSCLVANIEEGHPMTRRGRRITLLVSAVSVLAVATTLVLIALQDTIVFFYSPTQIAAEEVELNRTIRLGGLVEEGSVRKRDDAVVEFVVTDLAASVQVRFAGILPDLFREGQGIVVTGALAPDGYLVADQVLAKHDENYMPPEVAEALKQSGKWRGDDSTL